MFHKLRSTAVYVATALVGLGWAYIAYGCLPMVIELHGRGGISAIVFFGVVPFTGLALSVGLPIWLQRRGKSWLAMVTVLVSFALIAWGVLELFRAAGV